MHNIVARYEGGGRLLTNSHPAVLCLYTQADTQSKLGEFSDTCHHTGTVPSPGWVLAALGQEYSLNIPYFSFKKYIF